MWLQSDLLQFTTVNSTVFARLQTRFFSDGFYKVVF